jgi:cobalt-zinc-cadmium efflux system membrane fusion protein
MKNNIAFNSYFFTAFIFSVLITGCSSSEKNHPVTGESATLTRKMPHISNGGEDISFEDDDSSRFILKTDTAEVRSLTLTTTAPARIVVTMTPSEHGMPSVPVFESQDLTQLYTDYTKSKNDLAHAEHELDRLKDLFSHNAVAGKDVTQAETDLRAAQATVTGLESKLLAIGITPSELTRLAPNVSLLIASVPEDEIKNVQLGEDAQVVFDSYKGETLHGKVLEIGKALDPITRAFNVRIQLPNQTKILRPGMFARASFGIDVAKRFVVPKGAIITVQGKTYVFVTKDGKTFTRREVHTGSQTGGYFIVNDGLDSGELVVSEGAMLLKGLSFGVIY